MLRIFTIDDNAVVINTTSSKGCQNKWKIDKFYVKQDGLGYEGLVEYISSYILAHSDMPYVKYKLCCIKYKDSENVYLGCYSEDFLKPDESLITLRRLSEIYGFPFDKKYNKLSIVDKIKFVINNVIQVTNLVDFDIYLSNMLYIDMILLNEDRHFDNIAFIYSQSEDDVIYDYAPIFDNGAGLFSDIKIDYPLENPCYSYYKKVKAKSFTSDFEKQTKNMNSICKCDVVFNNLDFQKIESSVNETPYSNEIKKRVLQVLRHQFTAHKISCENLTGNHTKSADSKLSKIDMKVTPFGESK